MVEYTFQKAVVDTEQLTVEVNASAIAQDALSMDWGEPDALIIRFESALSQGDQDILAVLVATHGASGVGRYQANHYQRTPGSGIVVKEEWFETIDVQAGTVSGLAKRKTPTYVADKIVSYKVEMFFKNGLVASTENFRCWTDSNGNYIEEKVTT